MEDIEEEELLSLRLAIVTTDYRPNNKKKRKRIELFDRLKFNEGCEGKIFALLKVREQMLKLDHKSKRVVEDGNGLHLIHLLLISATSLDENKLESAIETLSELFQRASIFGDSVQRVTSYFADALIARLLTQKSPFYDMIMKEPMREQEFKAFMEYYKVSPYYQFAHFTANQAILEAFEEEEAINNNNSNDDDNDNNNNNSRLLHVIDFDVSYGFQWPSLIQSLSEKATNGRFKIHLQITGFGESAEELRETGTRLNSFAKGFKNLVFEFQGLLRGVSKLINLRKKSKETLVANLIFHENIYACQLKISETLKYVHILKPSIVIMVVQEGFSRNPRSFLSRFMESLHHFAAMFDSLDDCLPFDSAERMRIEKYHLGKDIKRVINYDRSSDDESNNYSGKYESTNWKIRMEGLGFEGTKLRSKCLIQAKLLLKIRSTQYCGPIQELDGENNIGGGGFRVFERDDGKGTISLGWQDRCLMTASAWHCV